MKTYDVKLVTWVQVKAKNKWDAMGKAVDAALEGAFDEEFREYAEAEESTRNEDADG